MSMQNFVLYESGLGVAQDFTKAREWYLKGAAAGDGYGQRGRRSPNSLGVAQEYVDEGVVLRKPPTGATPRPCRCMSVLYFNGQGVVQNYVKAREWLEKAVAVGSEPTTM